MAIRNTLAKILYKYNFTIIWLFPTTFLLVSAPIFFMIWTIWRLLTVVMPMWVYQAGDDFLYSSYQKLVLCFLENLSGLEVSLYGDTKCLTQRKQENVIFICNHQCAADWVIPDILAERQGSIGHIRYFLKDVLKYIPFYGVYFRQVTGELLSTSCDTMSHDSHKMVHELYGPLWSLVLCATHLAYSLAPIHEHSCIYVKRGSQRFEQSQAEKQLDELARHGTKFWMVVFPEGTRYNADAHHVIERSTRYARQHGLPVHKHLLTPRLKGVLMSLTKLRSVADAVYDVTVGFASTRDVKTGRRLPAPGMLEMLSHRHSLHLHIRRIAMETIPTDEDDIQTWLTQCFLEKDRLLAQFYSSAPPRSGHFGSGGQLSKLPLRGSVIVFLVWAALLLPVVTTATGAALYWQGSLLCMLGGWLWVLVFQ